jgi:hypothetical protein
MAHGCIHVYFWTQQCPLTTAQCIAHLLVAAASNTWMQAPEQTHNTNLMEDVPAAAAALPAQPQRKVHDPGLLQVSARLPTRSSVERSVEVPADVRVCAFQAWS